MALMCEECKCSTYFNETLQDYSCENGCSCCNTDFKASAQKYEDILKATTEADREADDETNPIIHAEQGPNRFATMSLFFNDSDGVRIDEDINLNEVTVHYFTDGGEIPLTEGVLYDWAVKFYNENY